jgi:hypothetical protein
MSRRPPNPGSETGGTEEGFVQRWSRRKAKVSQAEATSREEPSPPPAAAPPKVLTDADMPLIESLSEKSDYSLFLSPGVSEELRRLAFRKLFRLPEFSQRFELDSEYYDCTSLEPLGSIITHDMREEMKRAAEKLAETLNEPPQPGDTSAAPATEPVAAPTVQARTLSVTGATAAAPAKTAKPTTRRRTRSRRKS